MSLFKPDGTYIGEIPSWFTPPDPRLGNYVQMNVLAMSPRLESAKSRYESIPLQDAMINIITFYVGKHGNGAWKYRFADQGSLDVYNELRKREEKW